MVGAAWGTFIAFAPLISAIVVVSIAEGLPGLARLGRRVIRWRVNWIWYAAAIGLPLLVHAVAIGMNINIGNPDVLVAQPRPDARLPRSRLVAVSAQVAVLASGIPRLHRKAPARLGSRMFHSSSAR